LNRTLNRLEFRMGGEGIKNGYTDTASHVPLSRVACD
jgi:hypothetical protein